MGRLFKYLQANWKTWLILFFSFAASYLSNGNSAEIGILKEMNKTLVDSLKLTQTSLLTANERLDAISIENKELREEIKRCIELLSEPRLWGGVRCESLPSSK